MVPKTNDKWQETNQLSNLKIIKKKKKYEDTKWAVDQNLSRNSKKDNGQKKRDERTNNDL